MPTITLTKGLPGSGKTTWAQERAQQDHNTVNICKDDLRRMLLGGKWTPAREKIILKARDALIRTAMDQGKNIIVSDTNLEPRHEERIRQLAHEWNVEQNAIDPERPAYAVHVKDFTDVDVEECIKRDLLRANPVGERVIREQYNRYIRKVEPEPTFDPTLPGCVICDLDGTLAILNGRNPYDASTCEDDGLNRHVAATVAMWARRSDVDIPHRHLILFSGRQEKDREPTWRWLETHGIAPGLIVSRPNHYDGIHLYMRADGDMRKDSVVKREFYEAHVKGKFNVLLVLDDRLQVCRMWHELGLPLLRVGDPDATF